MTTELDREAWSYQRCDTCHSRRAQLVIDSQPRNRHGGNYSRHCWQCYWTEPVWRRGPIINCGPMWDGLDVRREAAKLE